MKKKLNKIIKKLLVNSGGLHILRLKNKDKAAILMYHNFCRSYDEKHRNLTLSINDFEQHIKYLKKYYNIISLQNLVSMIRYRKNIPLYSVAITFDDGYKNNISLAYPIIKKYKIPVTIFLTSAHIDTGDYLWVNELECAIGAAKKENFNFSEDKLHFEYSLKTPCDRKQAYTDMKQRLRGFENGLLNKSLAKIYRELEYSPGSVRSVNYEFLNWDDINEMKRNGIDFGSHSANHSILTKIEKTNLLNEVAGSKELLEERLKRKITLFCYPNGIHDDKVKAAVKEHYEAAVTTNTGFVDMDTDLLELPRIWTPRDLTDFAWNLVRPS